MVIDNKDCCIIIAVICTIQVCNHGGVMVITGPLVNDCIKYWQGYAQTGECQDARDFLDSEERVRRNAEGHG